MLVGRALVWSSLLVGSALALGLAGCATDLERGDPLPVAPDRANTAPVAEDRPYYEATPEIRAELERLFDATVAEQDPTERVKSARRFLAGGPAAVPVLVDALDRRGATDRATAAWLLGLAGDPRPLSRLDRARGDPDATVRFEAASAMLRLGDRRGVHTLVGGLEDADPRVREQSITMLRRLVGEDFGFRADDHADNRRAAVARWRAYAARPVGVGPGS